MFTYSPFEADGAITSKNKTTNAVKRVSSSILLYAIANVWLFCMTVTAAALFSQFNNVSERAART